MENLINFIFEFIGYMLLYAATDVGRKEESKLTQKSKKYWFRMLLIVIGIGLVKNFEFSFTLLFK